MTFLAAKLQLNMCTCASVCPFIYNKPELNFPLIITPYTTVHNCTQLYTTMLPFSTLYNSLHSLKPLFIPLYHYILLYPFTPLYTALHAFKCLHMCCKLSSSLDLIERLVYS